eukprot:403348985
MMLLTQDMKNDKGAPTEGIRSFMQEYTVQIIKRQIKYQLVNKIDYDGYHGGNKCFIEERKQKSSLTYQ